MTADGPPRTPADAYRHAAHLAADLPVNAERWTVRAHRHVDDAEWCGRCWDRALA